LLLRKSDEFVAARIGTTDEYGTYYVGADLGGLPVGELGPAMLRAFLPVLSSIKNDLHRTNQAVLKTLAAVNTLTLPVAFGVAAVAVPLTHVVLGDKWSAAAPIVAVFALIGAAQFVVSPLRTLLILHGHTRSQSTTVWIEFIAFCLAALWLAPEHHLIGLAWARLLASLAYAVATAFFTRHHCALGLRSVLHAIWRPLLGALAMFALVTKVLAWTQTSALQLPAGVLAGACFFSAWTVLSWWFSGRPQGLESTVFDALLPTV
jgi:lipopolysaccharide exporter